MALTAIVAGNRAVISDVNQIINLLTGVTGSGTTLTLINNAESLIFQPSSDPAAGTRVWTVKNNAGTVLASMRFDGLLKLLAAAAEPATAVTGSLFFDTVTTSLKVYNGASWDTVSSTSAVVPTQPNLVLNSDFSRRTVFGLAMPEVFADTSGYTQIDGGTAPGVASNILTFGAANNHIGWPKVGYNASFWRDARTSATFKAVATAGVYELRVRYVDTNNYISIRMSAGNFSIVKVIAGTPTTVATVANALTLNRWYWLEGEMQGTTVIGKIYNTGGTTPGVTKASSTLEQTLSGTVADAAVVAGGFTITSDQAAAQWGGIATGNGGVYVETWLPESWSFTGAFTGTLGGQAIGFDESADSGPINKQWAMRAYIPATSRAIVLNNNAEGLTPDGSIAASTAYAYSMYVKVSGLGGSGALVKGFFTRRNSAGTSQGSSALPDAGETSWTRKTGTLTTEAGTRRANFQIGINTDATATGTAYFMLPQLEMGSAATAWRGASADDAPEVVEPASPPLTDITTTSTSFVDLDPRNLAANVFCPWDATLDIEFDCAQYNSGANDNSFLITVDGANGGTTDAFVRHTAATIPLSTMARRRFQVAAGKHRVNIQWKTSAGTATVYASTVNPKLRITMFRGK